MPTPRQYVSFSFVLGGRYQDSGKPGAKIEGESNILAPDVRRWACMLGMFVVLWKSMSTAG